MKIGILTHPLRFNYGGILQNYALQQVLKSLGHEVYTIDWNDDKSFIYMLLSYFKRLFLHYALRRKHIPTQFFIHLTRKQFLTQNAENQKFIEHNICRTDYIPSIKKLSTVNDMNLDMIVVGSDQVWQRQFIPYMFLDFIKSDIKKITYAASFGKSEWTYNQKETLLAKTLIQDFQAISVREWSAVDMCRKHFDKEAEWVLDPTLLLTIDDYKKVVYNANIPDNKNNKEYLFTYILDDDVNKQNIINAIKQDLNLIDLDVTTLDTSEKPSVTQWLKGLMNARFIVTDSFHGMAFSIIFNKQFIAIGNTKRGIDRFTSLLTYLGISNRLIYVNSNNFSLKHLEDIDYNVINTKLSEFRLSSINYLKKHLVK